MEEKETPVEEKKAELTREQQEAEYIRLQKMTVTKLREEVIAKYHDEIKGVHGMRKDEIIAAMCQIMGIVVEEKHKPKKIKVKMDKKQLKSRMKKLRAQLASARENKEKKQLNLIRKKIKKAKRTIRKVA
jgi:hypothetical protein